MQTHVSRLVRRPMRASAPMRVPLRTLTLQVPRTYNPDANGVRKKVELSKLVRTLRELRQLLPGYTVLTTRGSYLDPQRAKWIGDRHFRFECDLRITPSRVESLKRYKRILERRFEQQEIYMRLSDPVIWV